MIFFFFLLFTSSNNTIIKLYNVLIMSTLIRINNVNKSSMLNYFQQSCSLDISADWQVTNVRLLNTQHFRVYSIHLVLAMKYDSMKQDF